jgi:hypothetical protein
MPTEVSRIVFKLALQGTLIGSSGARQDINFSYEKVFSDGSGANQANNFRKIAGGTLAAAATLSVDMSGWTDFQGTAVAPANIKLLILHVTAVSAAGGTLLLSAGASNHLATMFPDASKGFYARGEGVHVIEAAEEGYNVTAGTGDLLLLTAATADFTFDLYAVTG